MNAIQRYLIGGIAGLLALIGTFFYGVGVGKDEIRAENAQALHRAALALERAQAAIAEARAAVALIDARRQSEVREVYREIQTVIRGDPIYRTQCISDDGVRLIDRAAAAANARPAGGPADPATRTPDSAEDGRSGNGESDRQR